MSLAAWIAIGVVAWIVVALLVAVLVGRVVRRRDRQVPREPMPRAARSVESDPRWPHDASSRTPEPRRPRG